MLTRDVIMAKLFALEDETSKDSNDLLIDKVLQQSKEPKSPMSLTGDILAQRHALKKEITAKLEEEPETNEENSTEEEDSSEGSGDTPTEDSSEESKPDDKSTDEESKPDNSDEAKKEDTPKKDEDKPDEEDETSVAEDADSLKGIIGSGLSNKEEKTEEKEPEKKEEAATESYKPKLKLSNIFSPILSSYDQYKVSLEAFNLQHSALAIEQQPIVYVKDSVVESLNNLIQLANNYIGNNERFITSISDSVKNLNERITVFKGFVEAKKYHFTNKLINDKDILQNLSCPGKSDLRETIRILLRYIENSGKAINLVTTNTFDKLSSSFATSDFEKEADTFSYKETLPGFGVVRVSLQEYRNYLTTKLEEYHYYKLQTVKTEDIYSLNAITVAEDKELVFLMSSLDSLLVNITVAVDNLRDINAHFAKFIDDVKVIIYDIQSDKQRNLAEVGIDGKVQDFIKFKLAIEAHYININTMIDYMTSVMSVLNECIELKD